MECSFTLNFSSIHQHQHILHLIRIRGRSISTTRPICIRAVAYRPLRPIRIRYLGLLAIHCGMMRSSILMQASVLRAIVSSVGVCGLMRQRRHLVLFALVATSRTVVSRISPISAGSGCSSGSRSSYSPLTLVGFTSSEPRRRNASQVAMIVIYERERRQ